MTDSDVCLAHADEKQRVSTGFGVNGGRPRKLRAIDVLRERVEAEIDKWLKPLEDGLTAERAIVVGDGSHARLEFAPDMPVRLKAAQMALDRVYGRPAQQHDVKLEADSQMDRDIERLLSQFDHRDAVANGNGNGHRSPA
jgi:hypothetical protein